jgi:hypothetical protein
MTPDHFPVKGSLGQRFGNSGSPPKEETGLQIVAPLLS